MKLYSLVVLLAALTICDSAFSQDTVIVNSSDTTNGDIFARVEKESEFPGGFEGWRKFLTQNLKYPRKAQRDKIEGTVVVQFIVFKDGTIHDIEAISGPPELRDAAKDVIKKSPRWIPAEQSGNVVKSFKKQPIGFKL